MMKVVAALALILAAAGPARAQSLDEVVRDVETAYGRITDLRAEFSQSSFNKSLNQTIPAKGTVYLKKGGKLRWEYTEPTAQEIVSDGKKLWVYTPTLDRKSTRLNSSHRCISYAVFCLKKKRINIHHYIECKSDA